VFGQVDGSLVVVDLVHRTIVRTLRPWGRPMASCGADPLVWQRADRIVASLVCGDAHRVSVSSLAVVDVSSGRLLRAVPIGIPVSGPVRLPSGGALLLTEPPSPIEPERFGMEERRGPTRLTRVDGDGSMTTVVLRVRGGINAQQTVDTTPALVLLRGRAYVLGEGDPVAEVDPATLAVRYHRVSLRAQPERAQKPVIHDGTATPARIARRTAGTSGGCLLVTGFDTWTNGREDWSAPAGLRIVDVRTWTSTLLDPRPDGIDRVRGRVVYAGAGARVIRIALPRGRC